MTIKQSPQLEILETQHKLQVFENRYREAINNNPRITALKQMIDDLITNAEIKKTIL
jgi:hypothetical protein